MQYYILHAALAMFIVILLMPVSIYVLQNLKFGQKIRELGPSSHQDKEGIPTMGGAIFFPVIFFLSLFWMDIDINHGIILFVIFINWFLGVVDDFTVIRNADAAGISGWIKLIFQAVSGLVLGLLMYYGGIGREVFLPVLAVHYDLGITVIPFAVLVMISTTNAVNLSDGLDGLAGGLIVLCLLFFLPFLLREGHSSLLILSLQGAGVMLGFLWYNFYPAQVFMGDAGSLMMGALIASVALTSGFGLMLILLGGIFVLETLSVIIQVLYYRLTDGKRIFNMTPLHHHFELAGWQESKVTFRFYILQIIFGLIALYLGFFW